MCVVGESCATDNSYLISRFDIFETRRWYEPSELTTRMMRNKEMTETNIKDMIFSDKI